MKLLPLGSVIKVKDRKVSIIGYGSDEKDETMTVGYFVVPYPIGFTSIEKVFFIPHNTEIELVAEGYKTEPSEQALNLLVKSFEAAKKIPYDDLAKINEALKKLSLKQKEDSSK